MSAFGFPTGPADGQTFSKWVWSAATNSWVMQEGAGSFDDLILDEDDFASNSPSKVPSQQSTKAYVDSAVANIDFTDIVDNTVVTEAEGIASNDNDTTLPTSAAVKAYADGVATGGLITTAGIAAATLVTEADAIASNDNDTTIPTSAAVKDYADGVATGGLITTAGLTAGTLVTEADAIASNDNDTTLPTSAAVKDFVDTAIASGNAATVTNGVYTTGNQTIAGTKTFSSTISGSINGNAATATTATNVNRQVIAGTGMTGGGTLTADRTLNVIGGTGITANANDIALSTDQRLATGNNILVGTSTSYWQMQSSSGTKYARLFLEGDEDARITEGGQADFNGDVVAFSTTIASDIKFKTAVETIDDALRLVKQLRGVRYVWKENTKKAGQREVGLIAQEVQEVVPEVVKEVDTLGTDETHLTVDYAKLVGVLVEAVKELDAKVKKLESR
jgi:hypothetical protein